MNLKRVISGTVRSMAIFLAILLLFLTALFGLAQTEMGRRGTAKLITELLSNEGESSIEVKGFQGLLPFDFQVDHIAFNDQAGQWLVLKETSFRWLPLSLLKGIFHVENLDVKHAQLSRFVQSKGKSQSGLNTFLSHSLSFQWLRVDRFAVERLGMSDAVIGKRTDFRASGKVMSTDSDGGRLNFLRFDRMDGGVGRILLEATLRGEEPILTINLDVEEDAEGLIPKLLEIHHPIIFSVHGAGPVHKWNGVLRANIVEIGSLGADIGLAIRDTPAMTAQGVLRTEPGLMPSQMLPMFDGEGRFGLAIRLLKSNVLSVDFLTLNAGSADLRLSGRMDLEKETVDGQFTFGCKDLGFLGAATNVSCAGNLTADGRFSGPLLQPIGTVNIKAMGLQLGSFRVSELGGNFNLRFLGEPAAFFPGIHVSGSGNMADVSFQDARKAQLPFPEPRLKWKFDADVPMQQSIHIRQLELAGEKITMALSGRVNTAGPGGTLHVLLDVLETQGFSDLMGFDLPGPARLIAKIQGDQYSRSLTAHVQGKISLLARDYEPVASLFGGEIEFGGDLSLTESNNLNVSDLCLETRAGDFVANGTLDLSQGNLDSAWCFLAPELDVFSTALKRNMGGSLLADGEVKGVPGKMTLTAKAVIHDFLFQELRFDIATAAVHARETTSGGVGDLSVELRQADNEARGKTNFALKGHDLTLSSIFAQAAGSQVHGNMTFFLDRDLAEGVLQAECEDISDTAALFGKEIKGSIHIETLFQVAGTDQQVLFVMGGKGLAGETGQARSLKMNGRLTKLAGVPQGDVALDIEGLSFNELSAASLTLMAEGNTKEVAFSGKVGGKYKSDFEIAASGHVISSQEGIKLNLDQLNGQLGGSILELKKATQIKRTTKGWEFEPFVLKLNQGHIQGLGRCMDGMLDVNIKFEDLPLEVLQFAGLPGIDGMAAGGIDFSGPMSSPQGGIVLRLDKAGFRDGQYDELPPSVLQAKAALKNNSVHADFTLEGWADRPLEFGIEIPVRFSLSPFAWTVPPKRKLRGRLAGGVDLAHVFLFVDLPDHNLDGQMEIDLSLYGTAGDPRIKGYARIQDGVYENVRSGTFLKDAELEIAANNSRLVVESGRMSDGEGGAISLQGWVDLVPMQNFPFDVELVFEKVALVRQDYATATAEGKLSFSGSLAEAIVAGQLEIVSADFQIPKHLPQDIAELEVVELNREGDEPESPQVSAQPKKNVIKLNASVLSPGHVFIRGRGLESEWKGNLQFTGNAGKPLITGKLSAVRGFFNFLGKSFNLKEGRINFYGASPPSPSLEVLAEFSAKDTLARLRLSGPITRPTLELSSEPSLPKDEILSQILFGRSMADITPVQAIQLVQSVDSLARGSIDFLWRVRSFLGVDQLEVKQTENGVSENDVSQTGIEASAISVGKYVHEKVYVTTERGMQDESGKVTVEVEVTPNITVETEVRENAEGGMGVNWKWNY